TDPVARLEHDDGPASLAKLARGGQTGQAAADDGHVGLADAGPLLGLRLLLRALRICGAGHKRAGACDGARADQAAAADAVLGRVDVSHFSPRCVRSLSMIADQGARA